MGYYINTTSKGEQLEPQGKAAALIADGGTKVDGTKFEENLVCVVDNGPFEAAGYAYSEDEYEEFKRPDHRSREWLIHPQAKQLSGFND